MALIECLSLKGLEEDVVFSAGLWLFFLMERVQM